MTTFDIPSFDLIVTGDIVIDHHLYEDKRASLAADHKRGLRDWRELGGAAALCRLMTEIFAEEKRTAGAANEKAMSQAVKPPAKKSPAKPEPVWRAHLGMTTPAVDEARCGFHAFATWRPFPPVKDDKNEKKLAWRAEALMGYGDIETAASAKNLRDYNLNPVENLPSPHILLLDDGGYRFRNLSQKECWLLPGKGAAGPEWIFLKMSWPIAQGDLWHELVENYPERLVCLVLADELRRECVSIGSGLSWERTVEELRKALTENPVLARLNCCKHLIVRFNTDGALWVNRTDTTKPVATLIYDAGGAEGEWERDIGGKVIGHSTVMSAALGYELACHVPGKGETPDIAAAVAAGLAGMRDLHQFGHGVVGEGLPNGFPATRLAKAMLKPRYNFANTVIPWPESGDPPSGNWMIVEELQHALGAAARPSLVGLARQVVLQGRSAIKRLPHAQIGDLLTADRAEIETLRNLRRLMIAYENNPKRDLKPLSLGVFGPPGAGKSFGVKQLANGVFGKEAWLEFNLSQFSGPTDLNGAFHQVRDRVLSGVTPVVFWDEFDSKEYYWLQYLLAPMQDGRFQDGPLNHAIGKCVFVFAGGTSPRFSDFGPPHAPNASQDEHKNFRDFQLRKGPDFTSRLDAYYDVAGPNPRTLPRSEVPGGGDPPLDPRDVCAPLRRALLIRGILGCKADERLDIDSDLADALLLVPKYTHGSRSLEKLVKPLNDGTGAPIRRSSLPATPQMAMHVDAAAFAAILNRSEAFKMSNMIEPMAQGIHETWRTLSQKEGWKMEPRFDKPYSDLAEIDKEDNRAAARRIPEVLALAGMGVADEKQPVSLGEPTVVQIKEHLEHHLERLAEAEHDGWMDHRLKNGWCQGELRSEDNKIHPLLVPYASLPEKEKNKDRNSVRHFPDMLARAGYKVIWLKE